MDIQSFLISLLNVVCEMAPYLLLGFLIAGVLHVFVPQRFYATTDAGHIGHRHTDVYLLDG